MQLRVAYEELENRGFDAGGGEILYYEGVPFTGMIIEYNDDGILIGESEFTDGHIGGVQRDYYYNGQQKKESFIAFNTPYGRLRTWNEKGEIIIDHDFGIKPFSLNLVLDVFYHETFALVAGILFDPETEEIIRKIEKRVEGVYPYIPGQFYKRELPCLLSALKDVDTGKLKTIIIDGHVYIDGANNFGLGGKLWEALHKIIPVIGVAKNEFLSNTDTVKEIFRGESNKPLYISAIGIDLDAAANMILKMKGNFRTPDLLKMVDSMSRS